MAILPVKEPREGAAPVPPFQHLIGTSIAGQYRVTEILGVGGMGVVVAARDLQLDRDVAIKLILPDRDRDGAAGRRFLREGRVMAKLDHPNIVRVLAAGQEDDGRLYIVQELLDGETLRDHLALTLPFNPGYLVRCVRHALAGVAEAHRAGIVHRDLKPDNLFLIDTAYSGRVKVLDFGLAKEFAPVFNHTTITTKAAPLGSGEYMSPEQMQGRTDVDTRSDVWSLGVVLYEVVAVGPPWLVENWPALVGAVMYDPLPDVRERSPWPVPRGLARVIHRALERDPTLRFANAGELLTALDAVEGELRPLDAAFKSERRPVSDAQHARLKREALALDDRRRARGEPLEAVERFAHLNVRAWKKFHAARFPDAVNEIVLRLLARGVEMPVASRTPPLSLAIQGQHPDDAEALRRSAFVYNGVTGTWRWSAEARAHA